MPGSLPLMEWLQQEWPSERDRIEKLPFVTGACKVSRLGDAFGALVLGAFVSIQVDLPSAGSACPVREVEHVLIGFRVSFPDTGPCVLLRHDFPPVPHLTSRHEDWRIVCLTRNDPDDWWCGRTLPHVVKDVYNWLCDAAAGRLVKPEDPFEPLIVAAQHPPVELDAGAVKKECAGHGGLWQTEASGLAVGGRDVERFMLPGRGIPACVWYQPTTCDSPWVDPPESLTDIVQMAVSIGLDRDRLTYWVDRGTHTRLLLVLGVKRSRVVLGRPDAEEWVAFDLRRSGKRSKEWEIASHPVLDSFSMRLARLTSGFQEEHSPVRCLMIGVGALGSVVADSLARSGLVSLRIIDEDVLRPHNLARHALSARHIGQFKASALATELNALFEGREDVCEAGDDNFLRLTSDRMEGLLKDVHFVLDLSASLAVELRLADLALDVPVVSAYQIAAGRGTIVLLRPSKELPPLDMLDAFLMTTYRDDPVVASWLVEVGDPIMIGGGCRSLSSRISDSTVRLGAAWLADLILRWCSNDGKWPTSSRMGLMRYSMDGSGEITTDWTDVACKQLMTQDGWAIRVAGAVEHQISCRARETQPEETGGIMIGRVDPQRQVVNITEAWPAPRGSDATKTGFTRGLGGLKARIAMLEADTGEQLTYVGEWHSHPPGAGTGASAVDSATALRMAKELEDERMPAVCLITDGVGVDAHVVENPR